MNGISVSTSAGGDAVLRSDEHKIEVVSTGPSKAKDFSVDIRNLLDINWADVSRAAKSNQLELSYLIRRKDGHKLEISVVTVSEEEKAATDAWKESTLRKAYGDAKRSRKVLILVNPIGGKGKAKSLVDTIALPVLKAAGCSVEVMETKYAKHAEEIARDIPLSYDVIASASGDGLVHEILNGLASRADAKDALRTPIAPIPAGSANAMSLNLFGLDDGFDVALACLNVIKGKDMPLDMCSVTQGNTRRFIYLTIAAGLMCDVDLGTEHLRWMGDARFVYGFIRGIFYNSPMKCKIHMKVKSADKGLMKQQLNLINHVSQTTVADGQSAGASESADIPPARILEPESDWVTLVSGKEYGSSKSVRELASNGEALGDAGRDAMKGSWKEGEGFLYIYTGMMPYVARDLMQFPVCRPGEGVIDVAVQSIVPRMVMMNAISGAPKGEQFYLKSQHYYKATALVIEPEEAGALISVDGESFPFERTSVEIVPRMANTLSLYGSWAETGFAGPKK